jgi:hypothetical protein
VVTDLVLSVADSQPDCSTVYIATFTLTDGSNVVAAVQGSGQLAIFGTVVYAFSWGLLGLGVWLAGPEVVTTVKAWFHARLGKGRRGSR